MQNRILRLAFVEKKYAEEFKEHYPMVLVEILSEQDLEKKIEDYDIAFISEKLVEKISKKISTLNRRPTLVLVCEEDAAIPNSYGEGNVDDILSFPLRAVDALRTIRAHQNLNQLRDVEHINAKLPDLLHKIQEDICFAQKIQRRFVRDKFPSMGPLSFSTRYWCGLQPGGEYFDIFETTDSRKLGIFFSDSSSYALSTKLISALSQGAHTRMDSSKPKVFLSALLEQIKKEVEKPEDHLSLFYGVVDKLDLSFSFIAQGKISLWLDSRELFQATASEKIENWQVGEEVSSHLQPSSQLVLLSDGFANILQKPTSYLMAKVSPQKRESKEMVQDLAFLLRRRLEKEETEASYDSDFPFPAQDCSILVCDVKERVLRVAR